MSCADLDGGACCFLHEYAPAQLHVPALAISSDVYWIERAPFTGGGAPRVFRSPLIRTLQELTNPDTSPLADLVVSPSDAFWSYEGSAGGVRKHALDLDAGPVIDFISGLASPVRLAIAGAQLFFTDGAALKRAPTSDGAQAVDLQIDVTDLVEMTATTSFVYWTTAPKDPMKTSALHRLAVGAAPGAKPDVLATGEHLAGLAINAQEDVYWIDRGDDCNQPMGLENGAVLRLRNGEMKPAALANGQRCPEHIALDDRYVFWTTADSADTAPGSVWRADQ